MDTHPDADSMGCRETIKPGKRRIWEDGPIGWLTVLTLAGCALYASIFLYHGIRLVAYPFDVDNSEAYLIYQGERLSQGQFLYPPIDTPPYTVDNYPPLYPALTGLGFLLFSGANFHWPRFLSFLSTLSTAAMLGYWVFLLHRNKVASCLTGMIYLSFYHVNDWGALARVDALGVALATGGILVFEKSRSGMRALPWVVLSLLTRQTLFAAPLAIFATFLACGERKSAFRFGGILVACGAIAGIVLLILSEGRAWKHLVVYNANEFRFSDVMNYVNQWLRFYAVWGSAPLVILLSQFPRRLDSVGQNSPLLFWFTLFSLGEALLCGKIGSAPNYLLSLVAVSAVGVGCIFHELSDFRLMPDGKNVSFPLLVFLCGCILQLGATWHWPHSRMAFSETPAREDGQQVRVIMNILQRTDGPILSDRAGVALLAGHPPYFQPFIFTQLVREGKWDQSDLLERIRCQEFPLVLLQFNLSDEQWDREQFTPETIESLRESYILDRRIVRYGSGIVRYYLYRPKI